MRTLSPTTLEASHNHIDRFLQQHPVYKQFLPQMTIYVCGSQSTGSADNVSDIDLTAVLVGKAFNSCYSEVNGELPRARNAYLFTREQSDIEIMTKIRPISWLTEQLETDFIVMFYILHNSVPLQDPLRWFTVELPSVSHRFSTLSTQLLEQELALFRNDLYWLSLFRIRKLSASFDLLKASFVERFFRLLYLADRKPYPYKKWLAHWSGETRLGRIWGAEMTIWKPCSLLRNFSVTQNITEAESLYVQLLDGLSQMNCGVDTDKFSIESDYYYKLLY